MCIFVFVWFLSVMVTWCCICSVFEAFGKIRSCKLAPDMLRPGKHRQVKLSCSWVSLHYVSSPAVDNVWAMIVWRIRGKIIRTVLCCVVYYGEHSDVHAHMSSSCSCRFSFRFDFCIFFPFYWCVFCFVVEELDGGPTPFQCFAVHHCGQWDFAFFGQKIARG